MSVALATMESAYGLSRLGMTSHLHHLHRKRAHSPDEHVAEHHLHHHRRRVEEQPESASPLRFSVVNILRPDFGREAILNTRTSPKTTPIKVTPLPVHSPVCVPRDLSLSTARLAAQSPPSSAASFSSHCGLTSPIQRPTSNLSRSGSLESLASNRSSVTGGSVTGAASVASSAGSESVSGESTTSGGSSSTLSQNGNNNQSLWPAWIYCTRYSDRPSSGPRTRRVKRASGEKPSAPEEKRPRTAFSPEQLAKLKDEFAANRYLNETRRQKLSKELGLNEQQIKIWFQNKRAKIKKASGQKNPLALQLMAQGLYNHSTVPVDEDGEEIPPGHE